MKRSSQEICSKENGQGEYCNILMNKRWRGESENFSHKLYCDKWRWGYTEEHINEKRLFTDIIIIVIQEECKSCMDAEKRLN